MASRIEQWSLDNLIPYAPKSRTHSDEQVAEQRSMKEFRFINPIIAGSDRVTIAVTTLIAAAIESNSSRTPGDGTPRELPLYGQRDGNDLIKPVKSDREKDFSRIDLLAAMIDGLARALVLEDKGVNYHGLFSVGGEDRFD